jgi:hypothetical protein
MCPFKIDFNDIEWQSTIAGARFKAHVANGRKIRLLEISSEFIEPAWCEKGHIGFVLDGSLEIDFLGQLVTYNAGDGLLIPSGPSTAHKAHSLTPVVRLILVEDV